MFAAAAPVEFPPWARPSATQRRIGFERYSNKVLVADGTAWQTLWEDTGWVDMNPDWGTFWEKVATCSARRRNSTVSFGVQLERKGALSRSDPDGSRLVTLPSGMRPVHHVVYGVGQFTSGVSGRIVVRGDGSVTVDRLSGNLGGGEHLRFDLTFLI
ncbi:hypothetical protein ACFHW2_11790 [Actinomadura sp. LOL_016]|uniref:hypothetical protein n=1 Tax=unclassified Actinomadura TaxID=2626254 RepID=UPI003A801CFC